MWQSLVWACSVLELSCGLVPNVAVTQTAYDREEAAGSTLHSKDLKVLHAQCRFDIARTSDGWALKSGLCRR